MGSSPGWSNAPAAELALWTEALLAVGASLFQLPYWNEPLRALGFAPVYLLHAGSPGDPPDAFACVLRFGPPGARVGLVQRGPAMLADQDPRVVLRSLVAWARARGFVFLRFTHGDTGLLEAAAALPRARRENGFPFYRDPHEQLLVSLDGDDENAMLAGFQPLARRKIRKAERAGYRLTSSREPEDLVPLWPLFEALAQRKGFSYRPRASFESLMRLARPFAGTRLYAAWLGERPVEAICVARDQRTAYYISGALDVEALGGVESPSALLHWTAMRELAQEGVRAYDLGTRSGAVYEFKRIFRPREVVHAEPVTVVTGPVRYRAWSASVLRLRGGSWRRVKAVVARVLSSSRVLRPGRKLA